MKNEFKKLLSWILPTTCVLCKMCSTQGLFCESCRNDLPWIESPCVRCATPSPVYANRLCGKCLMLPPPITQTIALFHYQQPIISLITKLKFRQKIIYARALGDVLGRQIIDSRAVLPELIIPVPLHKKRLIIRGFNQAAEIAKPISRLLNIPVDLSNVIRIKNTSPQTLTAASKRKANVKDAFAVKKDFFVRHVALVDDVITTFNTLSELAAVLLKQGVERVDAWCIAKAGVA